MSIEQCVNFALELDRLKAVTRAIKPLGQDRYENPAEHSWQVAALAMALAHCAAQPVDVDRVIRLILVHDIGEIDAGDQLAFLPSTEQRHQAEEAGARRVFETLPPTSASAFFALWREFEDGTTPEARFAQALDRAIPVILNLANGGQSWKENGITFDRVVARVERPIKEGCPALWTYLSERLQAARNPSLFGTQPVA